MKDKISHVSDFDRRKHDPSNNNKPESGLAFCCCKLERRRSFSFGTNFKEIPRGDNSRSSVIFNSCRKWFGFFSERPRTSLPRWVMPTTRRRKINRNATSVCYEVAWCWDARRRRNICVTDGFLACFGCLRESCSERCRPRDQPPRGSTRFTFNIL